MNTLFVCISIIVHIHICELNVKTIVKVVVDIAELLKYCILILIPGKLIVNIIETNGLSIVIFRNSAYSVLVHLKIGDSFLGGIDILVFLLSRPNHFGSGFYLFL